MLLYKINKIGGDQMSKVRLIYVCTTANFVATKEVKIPHIREGMEISQIFDSVVANNDEGEIFTITKIRYLLKDKIYIAFIEKKGYCVYDRAYFSETGWKIK